MVHDVLIKQPVPAKAKTLRDDPTAIVDRIRHAKEILNAAGDADDPDAAFVAQGLAAFLDLQTKEITFEQALRLPPTWRSAVRRAARNQLIREIAIGHFGIFSLHEQARGIARAGLRYEADGAWKHDKENKQPPKGLPGELYRLLCFGDFPGEETIRKILSNLPG